MSKGFLGKALAAASVVALVMPLLSYTQAAGVLPGSIGTDGYATAAAMEIFKEKPQPLPQLVAQGPRLSGEISHTFIEPASAVKYGLKDAADTDISFGEAIVGFAVLSPAFSLAGLSLASKNDSEEWKSAKEYAGTTLDAAGKSGQLSMILNGIGHVTDSTAFKGAAAGAAIVAVVQAATIPPNLAIEAVRANFFQAKASAPSAGIA